VQGIVESGVKHHKPINVQEAWHSPFTLFTNVHDPAFRIITWHQCRLSAWVRWEVARGPLANLWMLCTARVLMFIQWLCWKY